MDSLVPPVGRIEIELTSACQLHCRCCPLTFEKEYRGQHLAFEDFLLILERVRSAMTPKTYFSLNGFGEFFIYPHYKQVSAELLGRGFPITFHSNGLDLDVEYLAGLEANSPEDDPISVTVKCGNPYREEEAVDNVIELMMARPRSRISVRSLYGENARLREASARIGFEYEQIVVDNWAGYFEFSPDNPPHLGCERFFPNAQVFISVRGDVSVCCKDFGAQRGRLGSLYEQTLAEILHGPLYREWLNDALGHNLMQRDLCKGCFRAAWTEGV